MKRRVLLVDDEVAVLLTLKAVLEISGFDVDTATSAREGKARIRHREYDMVITDLRMEDERAGLDVISEARDAAYKPAIALLTAFPEDDPENPYLGADKLLMKPMHTRELLLQLEALLLQRDAELSGSPIVAVVKEEPKKSAAKRSATKKLTQKKQAAKVATKGAKKTVVKKLAAKAAKKTIVSKKKPAKTAKPASKKAVTKSVKKAVKKGTTKKAAVVKKTSAKKTASKTVKKAAKKVAWKKTARKR